MKRPLLSLGVVWAALLASAAPLRVTLTFDDCLKDHLLVAAPQLEARGWRGTFNLVSDLMGADASRLSWADARELVQRGHELAVHGKSHCHMRRLLQAEGEGAVQRELALCRDAIADNTGFAPRFYCSPYSEQDEATARLARLEGLEQMMLPRRNFGTGAGVSVKAYLLDQIAKGVTRVDIMHHGVCSRECGGHGGHEPFGDEAAFAAHLDAIADLERAGQIIVTDYDGMLSSCALKAPVWPRHGVIALSFDDHSYNSWRAAFPIFAKYRARATFFMTGAFGADELAFVREAMLAGHEIGLHALHHRDADVAASRNPGKYWAEEIEPQLSALRVAGVRPRSFAYPNCVRTPAMDELFRTNGFTRVRGLRDGTPSPTPYDPKNEKGDRRRPPATCDSEFRPALDYLKVFRIRNIILGESYHTKIDETLDAVRRAGARGEMVSIISHEIAPNAGRINMKTEWLEKLLAEADSAGVIIRGAR